MHELELVLLSDAKPAEYLIQNIFTACFAGDFGEMIEALAEFKGDKLDGLAFFFQEKRFFNIAANFYEGIPVSHVGDEKGVIFPDPACESGEYLFFQDVETLSLSAPIFQFNRESFAGIVSLSSFWGRSILLMTIRQFCRPIVRKTSSSSSEYG